MGALTLAGCWASHALPPDGSVPADAAVVPGCFEGPVAAFVDESGGGRLSGLHFEDTPDGFAVVVTDPLRAHVMRLDDEARRVDDTWVDEAPYQDLWRLHFNLVGVRPDGIEALTWNDEGELSRTWLASGRVIAMEPPVGDMRLLLERDGSVTWATIVDRGGSNVPFLFDERAVADLPIEAGTSLLLTGDTLRAVRGLGTGSPTGQGYHLSPEVSGLRATPVGPEGRWPGAPLGIGPLIYDDTTAGGGLAVTVRWGPGEAETSTHLEVIPHYTSFPASARADTGVRVASGSPMAAANDETRIALLHADGARVYDRETQTLIATLLLGDDTERSETRLALRDDTLAVAYIDAGVEPLRPRVMVQCIALPR